MDILKWSKRFLIAAFVMFTIVAINAQSSYTPISDLRSAFKDSYVYESQSDYASAIKVLSDVYNKNNYEINLRLGWLTYLNKQYDESIKYYEIANKLMPLSIEAKFGLVYPYAATEKWGKVEEIYQSILNLDPNNSVANYRLGLIYYYKPDYDKAYKQFEKVVNSYPFDYYSVLMFAWTNFKLGKYTEAETLFNRVLLISPDDASALEGLKALNKQ